LAVAQAFGIMPVHGIKSQNPKHLRFKKLSFRFALCVFYITGFVIATSLKIHWMYQTKMEFGKIVNFSFNLTNFLSLICFLELASKWPQLMWKFDRVEKLLPHVNFSTKDQMKRKIQKVAFTILISCLGELLKIKLKKFY
jgi:gustatory receptor